MNQPRRLLTVLLLVSCGGVDASEEPGAPDAAAGAPDPRPPDPDAAPVTVPAPCPAAGYHVAYSVDLTPQDHACGPVERTGLGCNAAVDRFCRARGCAATGFGPVEYAGDAAVVVCVAATLRPTTFAQLASHTPGCASANAYSMACNSAIHRFCMASGFVSGHGPLPGSDGGVVVACSSDAQLVMTTYAELRSFHDGCDGAGLSMGGACNAAVSRFCSARGAVSGFGPVERNGEAVTVACVK